MAQGYAYGNARLRAMRSRLLGEADYSDLLAKVDVEDVIARLAETLYKQDIEASLIRFRGVRCVSEALRMNLTRTVCKVREFFEGEPRILVDILLRRWDRHNLLTILRGQSREVSSEVVLSTVVPVGELDEVSLREMARQPGLRAVIDLMSTWHLPYAGALRSVRARTGSIPDLDQLELALNRFHYAAAQKELSKGNGNRAIALEFFQTEVDLTNLRTALQLVRVPELAPLVRQRYHAGSVEPLLIEHGRHLPVSRLAKVLAEVDGLEALVHALSDTPYGGALKGGWERYQTQGGSITVMERELERWQAEQAAGLFGRDPLSIGIFIGYLGCKEVEIGNLRLIAQAAAFELKRDQVRRDLIIV
jgi:V/A-type H+-transporting ATPase subunit C